MTDGQLVSLSQQGDAGAFGQLVERWETSVYGFVRRMVGNPDDARDLCQEALTKAYVNIRRLNDGEKFKSWVHHIALNAVRDRFRTAAARADVVPFEEGSPDELAWAESRHERSSPDQHAARGNLRDVMSEVLGLLPEEQRTSILLREYQGFTSEEIGEMTGVPAATVRTRIFYGLKAARRHLEERGITHADFV